MERSTTCRTGTGATTGGPRRDALRSPARSGPWDTLTVGGEEADIDIFSREDEQRDGAGAAANGAAGRA
ncbi:hypothetical protein [Streptomonospora sediminis]